MRTFASRQCADYARASYLRRRCRCGARSTCYVRYRRSCLVFHCVCSIQAAMVPPPRPPSPKNADQLHFVSISLWHCMCIVDEFCLLLDNSWFTGPTQLSAVINFCMSPNSLEEKCNELLEVTDLVTYTWCHGSAGVLISCASLRTCARLPAVNSPYEVRV